MKSVVKDTLGSETAINNRWQQHKLVYYDCISQIMKKLGLQR